MKICRREFLLLTASFAAGCSSVEDAIPPLAGGQRVINAGPAANYAVDGVHGAFRERGFFIVRRDKKLFALSAICTHKKCKLRTESDHSFSCPCHGSTFDPNGHVTQGPARRDLPIYATSVNDMGELLVIF